MHILPDQEREEARERRSKNQGSEAPGQDDDIRITSCKLPLAYRSRAENNDNNDNNYILSTTIAAGFSAVLLAGDRHVATSDLAFGGFGVEKTNMNMITKHTE